MSGYIVRNPLMTDNAQFGPPPQDAVRPTVLPNPLATAAGDWRDTVAPQPTQADAADATKQAYTEWLARDRAEQVRLGYVDPATGALTPEGWRAQAQIIGGGFGPADIGAVGNALGTIKAYHGSPHSFDAFDMSKIGTGEGAQAYGHGLYFAENPGVAQGYRDKLAGPDFNFTGSGDPVSPALSRVLQDSYDSAAAQGVRNPSTNDAIFLAHKALDEQMDLARRAVDYEWFSAVKDQKIALDRLTKDPPKMGGHMYEVNLNAEPDQMLHWDKPLSEQSPHVENAVADLAAQYGIKLGNATGARVHQALADHLGASAFPELARTGSGLASDPVAAAEALRAAGIPGISYLDAGSRGAGQGSRNHVVFDDATIDILRKYGIAGLMAGGAATAFGGQDQGNQ